MCGGESCFSPLSVLSLPSFKGIKTVACTPASTSLPTIPYSFYRIFTSLPLAFARVTNDLRTVTQAHFSLSAFLDFAATWDTTTHLLVETHSFSWLPLPTTSSLVTTPQILYVLAIPLYSPASGPPFHAPVVLYIRFLLPGMASCSSKMIIRLI